MGPDAETVKPRKPFPVSPMALDAASGEFVNVYERYSWGLAGKAVACESREGICFSALANELYLKLATCT